MTDEEVYTKFLEWLRAHGTNFLMENDDLAMRMLRVGYTPEEAALLTGMSLSEDKTAEELAEIKNMDPVELKQQLDDLGMKGSVWCTIEDGKTTYRLNGPRFYMLRSLLWPAQRNEVAMAMAPLANEFHKYMSDKPTMVPIMDRSANQVYQVPPYYMTIPIEGTVTDPRKMMPYEDVVDLLENHWSYYSVSACVCAVRNNLDPKVKDCDHPLERCLHMDDLGRYIVTSGKGREVTLEEAKEILRQAREAGLFHSLNPIMMDGLDTLCNCCPDCCYAMEYHHKFGSEWATLPSNFVAKDNPNQCIGCGECVKVCPMNAKRLRVKKGAKDKIFTLEMGYKQRIEEGGRKSVFRNRSGKVSATDPAPCIGCGLCADHCSTKSIVLEQRKVVKDIPKGLEEMEDWSAKAGE